jgi:aspartate aminotransferase-like enzyme
VTRSPRSSAPDGISVKDLRNDLQERFGIQSAGGQEQLKGKIFRIGHMGYVDEMDAVLASPPSSSPATSSATASSWARV